MLPNANRSKTFKNLAFRLAAALTVIVGGFTLASQIARPTQDPPRSMPGEVYDPSYSHIRSVQQVVDLVRARKGDQSLEVQAHELEEILRRRFYHGYSRYGLHENWVAWLSAKLLFADLNALVEPEEILQHNAAACSQQAIITQAALRELGITYSSVKLPKHFFAAAWLDGRWFIVDPWGPVQRDRTRLHPLEDIMTVEGRAHLYLTAAERNKWDKLRFNVPQLVQINQFPARHAQIFHAVTRLASDWLWLPLLLLAIGLRPSVQRRRSFSIGPVAATT